MTRVEERAQTTPRHSGTAADVLVDLDVDPERSPRRLHAVHLDRAG